jgi:hypothetical protein
MDQCDYKTLAEKLDSAGWQQFSFVKPTDHSIVLDAFSTEYVAAPSRWIVVSHSCDLIHHTEQELHVELLRLEALPSVSADELALQSPRMAIITAYETGTQNPISFRARASHRLTVPRERLGSLAPDLAISLRSRSDPEGVRGPSEYQLSEWLASRYNRGWTPTEFDKRLSKNVGKIQPCLRRLRTHGVEEIFVRVTPASEIGPKEPYEIGLVILVDPEHEANLAAIQAESQTLARHIHQPGKVTVVQAPTVTLSNLMGYSLLRGWIRFHDVFRDSLASRRPATPAAPKAGDQDPPGQ